MVKKSVAKATALGVLGIGLLAGGGAVAGVQAPVAKADGCSSGTVPTTSWSTCDYGYLPDGSHTHCDAVFVFGFGGWNCFPVPPPPPPSP